MTNTTKFRINAEEIRLTNNRRMLIASRSSVFSAGPETAVTKNPRSSRCGPVIVVF